MKEITELFDKYKKNISWINNIHERLHESLPMEEWTKRLHVKIQQYKEYFNENDEIVKKILEKLEGDCSDEVYDSLYFECKKMYDEYLDDGFFLIKVFDKLIQHYEEKEDYSRVIICTGYSSYEENDVIRVLYNVHDRTTKYSYKILSYYDKYFELEEEARYRIWVEYYNLIVAAMDSNSITVEECFRLYDEMEERWNDPRVQELDGEKEKCKILIINLKKRMLHVEIHMQNAPQEIREKFCEMADREYEEELSDCENKYDINGVVYVAKLRSQVIRKEKTLDEAFDDIYEYHVKAMEHLEKEEQERNSIQDEDKDESVIQDRVNRILFMTIRNIGVMQKWIDQGVSKEKLDKVLSDAFTASETKWRKLEYIYSRDVDELMLYLLSVFIKMPYEKKMKERFIYEFGIRRQLITFVNAVCVRNISVILVNGLWEKNSDLFSGLGMSTKSEIIEYVEKAALFHNLGNLEYNKYRNPFHRTEWKEEIAYMNEHPFKAVENIKDVKELYCYRDVMLYHHETYDGQSMDEEGAVLEKYSVKKNKVEYLNSPYKIVIDIIAIADYLDYKFNVLENQQEMEYDFDNCMYKLAEMKGTHYNPDIVNVILKSDELRKKIKYNLIEGREQFVYSAYHSYQLGVTVDEQRDILEKAIDRVKNIKNQEDKEYCKQKIERLFEMAEKIDSDEFWGMTYFVNLLYHNENDDIVNMMNAATNALSYLKHTKKYFYISRCLNYLGIGASLSGDFAMALSYYIECTEYTRRGEGPDVNGSILFNIAIIFGELGQYVKAIEYLSKVEYKEIEMETLKINYLAFMFYYLLKIDCEDKAEEFKEELEKSVKETDESNFVAYTVLSYHACIHEKYELAKKYLAEAEKQKNPLEKYAEYINENNIYFEVLRMLNQYEKLNSVLRIHIDRGIEKNFTYHLLYNLIHHAIECAKHLNDTELLNYYYEKMEAIYYYNQENKQKMILMVEKNSVENVGYQVKHEKLLDDNTKLKEDIKKANDANNAKDTFLSSISHEIRTPIHAILGLNEMIIRETKDDNIRKYTEDIEISGKNLLGLVNDILDYSKLEAGKMEFQFEDYNTKDLIRELANSIEARTQKKNLSFIVKMNPSIPSKMYGDDLRVKQILSNILINAVKFTESGSVILTVDYSKIDDKEVNVKFTVSDTGIGMKPEEISKLSTAFVRLDEERNRTIEGAGLGLTIVTSLLKQMGSKLLVESTYGVGSTFSFTIKQKVVNWAEAGALKDKEGMVVKKKKGPLFTATNAKVLIVDDMQVNLSVLKGLLKRTKMQIKTAKSGKECLKLCNEDIYNIILMDHRMPEMDGVETLHHLREEGLNKEVPVIAVTANAISGAYEYYTKEGFDDLVLKPVDVEFLEEKIMIHMPKEMLDK